MKGVRFCCTTVFLFAAMSLANAQPFGINLITNPGGDEIDSLGTTAVSTSFYFNITDTATMFGWQVSGDPFRNNSPTTYRYDSTPGDEDYPLLSEGPFDSQGNYTGRLNFFFGGFNLDDANASTAYQYLIFGNPAIDGGNVVFDLSGWIGGYYDQDDSVIVSARFFDENGVELGSGSIGPLSPADRNFSRNFFYLETAGSVPVGTRNVRITMDFTGGFRSLDGYVDNLSFSIRLNGDVDGNNCIDDSDLLAVLFAFGQTCSGCPEDVNGDGVVDDADLLVVLFGFGAGC
jgi:hypothetical protein